MEYLLSELLFAIFQLIKFERNNLLSSGCLLKLWNGRLVGVVECLRNGSFMNLLRGPRAG